MMSFYEGIFIWIAIGLYSAGFLLFLMGMVFKKEKLPQYGFYLSVAGFVMHTGAIVVRWVVTGHLPVMQTYENSLAGW